MTDTEREKLREYRELLSRFLLNSMGPTAFQAEFLRRFREDPNLWTGEAYRTLEELFEEVDAYEADPAIRDKDMIDEDQLKRVAAGSLRKITALIGGGVTTSP